MAAAGPLWRRLRTDGSALFGLVLVAGLLLFALLGPWLIGTDPNVSDFALVRSPAGGPPPPSSVHLLGTDPLFRDMLSRLAHGARLSLAIATGATALTIALGCVVGTVAGYFEGQRLRVIDGALMRVVDVAMAFPYLLLVTAIGVAIDHTDAVTVTAILGLTGWTGVARVVRAKTLQTKRLAYVTAARALGAGPWRMLRHHLLPAVGGTLLVIGSHAVAQMILAEAVLGYLTVGIGPPQATWGRMLHEGEHYLGVAPLQVAAPAFAVLLSVLGFTRLGDGLRDALGPRMQPRSRGGKWRFAVDAAVLVSALSLVATARPDHLAAPIGKMGPASQARPTRGGVLRLASAVDIRTLEPALAYDEAARAVDDLLFARLLRYNTEGELVGELAARFARLDDGRRYRFWLRDKLRFHDGAALRAADVKRSLERMLNPGTPSPGAHLYRAIAGFDAFRAGRAPHLDGIGVVDAGTVDITLSEPDATFAARLTLGFAAPVCPSSGVMVDARSPSRPCGSGPFVLEQLVPGQRLWLRRFDGYFEPGKPYLDGVHWLLGVPARTQRFRFEAGEIDLVTDLTGVDAARYAADPRWTAQRAWTSRLTTQGVFLNTEMPPFDNHHLRRAVALAIDGHALEKVRPDIEPTTRVIPPAMPGPPSHAPLRHHDLEAALREMRLAGYPFNPSTGRGGYPDDIDYLTVVDTFEQSAGEVFQQQLARAGIRIRLRLVSWASYLSLVSKRRTVAMGWRGWGADFPDPSNFFEPILVSSAIHDEGSQNVSFFADPQLDALVRAAHVETNYDARMALYARAEERVRDQAPFIPVYRNRSLQLWQSRVHGYRPHPIEPLDLRGVWLDRGSGRVEQEAGP